MQIACSSWSLRRVIPRELVLTQFPAWCSSRGFEAIEITEAQVPDREPPYLNALRRACDDALIPIACLSAATDFTYPQPDRLAAELDRVRRLLGDLARPLNIPRVQVTLGTADPGVAGEERALEALRALVVDLEMAGMTLVVENHDRVQTRSDAFAALIAGVGSPRVRACIDLGSVPADRRDLAVRDLAGLADFVHARANTFTTFGEERDIDYKRAIAELKEAGYDGMLSVLYDGAGNPYDDTLATQALIRKHWYHPEAGYGELAA